uniref:Protein amnionless n=1 Tax=Caenorhabditis japonica TaxID=281687 RepID=A0A8R1DJ71_CAEJA
MGFKLVAISTWLLTISAFSVEKNAIGSGCIDLLCPDTAAQHGLRNLVNDDTLKTDACTSCSQCTDNGYSICLRPKDSRATRTAGGCSCSHTLAANCHTDLTQTRHPANLTMSTYTACYANAIQRPPQPLAVNENSSVVVTIEPFWLEPYWRHLKIENVTLHYKFLVKAPEHCEGDVVSTPSGVHTCTAHVLVDLSESKEDGGKDDDEYDHSDNYDQYDDDLPPEVQFDRDVFSGAKELESYYTATVRRSRQINPTAGKHHQIHDGQTVIESEHLKFDLKPEVYGVGESDIVDSPPTEEPAPFVVPDEEESATVVQEEKEGDVSEETGGTNFFEEEEKKEEVEKKKEEEDKEKEGEGETDEKEEDGVLKVNLEDIEPTKLKSQEEAKKKAEEEGNAGEDGEEEATTTTDSETEERKEKEEKEGEYKEEEEKKEDEKEDVEEKEGEGEADSTTIAGDEDQDDDLSSEDGEEDEETTISLVEADSEEQNFWDRFVNSYDFPRVRFVSLVTLVCIIGFCVLMLCIFYRRWFCCKKKESKTSNGYRYTSANPPTELVSREKEQLRQ